MTKTRVLILVFAIFLAVGVFATAGAQAPPAQDSGQARFEFARRRPWGSTVTPRSAQTFTLFERDLVTPVSVSAIDVSVTISLDYGVSRGDFGEIGASFRATDDPDAPLQTLGPAGLGRLSSAPQRNRTTTSVTWIAKNVQASGRAYAFQMGVVARDNNGDGRAQTTGKNYSIVVEMSPSEGS